MGSSNSQLEIENFEHDYTKKQIIRHPYFGHHYFLTNQNRREMMICKKLIFHSSQQSNHFWREYNKLLKSPFSIIYPKKIIKNDDIETCTSVCDINIYLDIVGTNLTNIVNQQGCFNENKTWFLLSQISKSLQILGEKGRPHWAISPDNIFENQYQNYLIYDNLFVMGMGQQNYLMNKLQNKQLMSPQMQILLLKGSNMGNEEGFQEDCYCLGFVLLYVLTKVHPNSLPKKHLQRHQIVKKHLEKLNGLVSDDLLNIIFSLTNKQQKQRIDNYRQLRKLIKDMQVDIIHNECQDYKRFGNRNKQKLKKHILKTNKSEQIPANYGRAHQGHLLFEERDYKNTINVGRHHQPYISHHHSETLIQDLRFIQYPQNKPYNQRSEQSFRSHELTRINSKNQLFTKK